MQWIEDVFDRRSRPAVADVLRRSLYVLILLSSASLSGCETFAWLKPHQLWKLNREPPLGGRDALFSVPAGPFPEADEL